MFEKHPSIGLTPQYNEANDRMEMRRRYTDAVIKAGGIALPIPVFEDNELIAEIAYRFDGFLFTGGDDVNPALYGEEKSVLCKRVTDDRDKFEIKLLGEALKLDKPVLGICRGIQVINVGLSGSLNQHIEGHSGVSHKVTLEKGTPLRDIITADTLTVNSYHHQTIKRLSNCLTAAATADDGTIEAVYMPGRRFFIAVQWHPEIVSGGETNEFDMFSEKLFAAFVGVCGSVK